MNVAVGGTWGGQQGIDTAAFEGDGQIMEVDWVRVYGERSVSTASDQIFILFLLFLQSLNPCHLHTTI
jgi:hypothetical protein